jgi:threonine dehydrogenase-like Zn-dependent dehydrogenase
MRGSKLPHRVEIWSSRRFSLRMGQPRHVRWWTKSQGERVLMSSSCVSLGRGVQIAKDAIAYVNTGGFVNLFAGFCSGDILALDSEGDCTGTSIDAWSVRTGWRTKRIHTICSKPVDVSGHCGSCEEDLATAVDLIHRDPLSFEKLISPIISLAKLADCMSALARDGTFQGEPASSSGRHLDVY